MTTSIVTLCSSPGGVRFSGDDFRVSFCIVYVNLLPIRVWFHCLLIHVGTVSFVHVPCMHIMVK